MRCRYLRHECCQHTLCTPYAGCQETTRLSQQNETQSTHVTRRGPISAGLAGALVTETFEYDGGRQVTAYVPPQPPEAVVFAGDGGWHISRLSEVLEASNTPPTMVVGVHGLPDDGGRLEEYVAGFDPQRFAAHERFF